MSFSFRCPSCNAERMVTEYLVGRQARCPQCNDLVTITAPDDWSGNDMTSQTVDPNEAEAEELSAALATASKEAMAARRSATPPPPPGRETEPTDASGNGDEIEAPPVQLTPVPETIGDDGNQAHAPWKEARRKQDVDTDGEERRPGGEEPAVSFATNREKSEAEMDMTPMVDVTFLLLIFFMVTASFTLQKSMEVPPQQEDEASMNVVEDLEEDEENIVVEIDQFNTYRVLRGESFEGEAPSDQELYVKMREAKNAGNKPVRRLMVIAHADALYEKVITALDAGTDMDIPERMVTMTEDDFD